MWGSVTKWRKHLYIKKLFCTQKPVLNASFKDFCYTIYIFDSDLLLANTIIDY